MDHQAADVDRLRYFTRINVWNDLGTGKTFTVAWWLQDLWMREIIDSVIIVGPGILFADWRNALEGDAWADGLASLTDCRPPNVDILEEAVKSKARPASGHLSAYFTTFQGAVALCEFDQAMAGSRWALIVDESHCVALPNTMQTKAARKLGNASIAVANMTATPIGRWSHLRVWALAKLVRRDVVDARPGRSVEGSEVPQTGTFNAFKTRYGYLIDPVAAKKPGQTLKVHRAYVRDVNVKLLRSEVLRQMAPYTARRSKDECLQLPTKVKMLRSYKATELMEQIVQDLLEEDRAILEDGYVVLTENALVERVRVLELAGGWIDGRPIHSEKLRLLGETIAETNSASELGNFPRSTLVWASRTRTVLAAALVAAGHDPDDVLARVTEEFEHNYAGLLRDAAKEGVDVMHGPTSARHREEIQARWKHGDTWCVVAHPGVAGAGLNWQHVRATIYYDQCIGSISRAQSEDRVHRKGLKHTAVYYDLVQEDGPDEAVAKAHSGQRDAQESVLQWLKRRIEAAVEADSDE